MPGETVLDAACATGYGSHMLSQIAGKVIGYEIDEGCIQSAKDNWQSDNTEFHVKDLNTCELPEVDALISIETVEHLDDMQHFIDEARKKVKRLIIICVPIGGTSWAYKDEPPGPATEKNDFMTDATVDKLVQNDEWKKQTGFRYGYSYIGVFFRKEPVRQ